MYYQPSSNSLSQPSQQNTQNQSSTSSSSNNIQNQQTYSTNPFVHSQQQLHQQQQQQQHQQQQMIHGYSMESEDGDIEDNRQHSLSSSKSNLSDNSIVS